MTFIRGYSGEGNQKQMIREDREFHSLSSPESWHNRHDTVDAQRSVLEG